MSDLMQVIEEYCVRKSAPLSADTEKLFRFTMNHVPWSQMLVGPLEGGFLGFLIRLIGAKNILEVGTFTGYSALCMAESLPPHGSVTTLDINEETTNVAKKYWAESAHGSKVQSILGPAVETMKRFVQEKKQFDFIFIDADKSNYEVYFSLALQMLSPHGMIAVDNCLWGGKVLDAESSELETRAIRAFNELVSSRKDIDRFLLPLRDGIFLIRKR